MVENIIKHSPARFFFTLHNLTLTVVRSTWGALRYSTATGAWLGGGGWGASSLSCERHPFPFIPQNGRKEVETLKVTVFE